MEADSLEGRLMSARIVYDDLRAFLNTHALPSQPQINIVLLDDIARSDSVALAVLGDIAGLAFSPEVVRVANDSDPIIATALGVAGDFTPTVLLSASRLRKMPDLEATVVIAHEVAHAMAAALGGDGYTLTVDLEAQRVCDGTGWQADFSVDPFRRHCLLNGLDDIGLVLDHEDKISAFERRQETGTRGQRPG